MFIAKRYSLIAAGGSLLLIGSLLFSSDAPSRFSFLYVALFLLMTLLSWAAVEAGHRHIQQLTRRTATYKAALEAAADAFYVMDPVRSESGDIVDFKFVEMNENALRQMQHPHTSLIGGMLCERLPANRTNGFFEQCERAARTGKPSVQEYQLQTTHAASTWCARHGVKVDESIVVITRDISALKAAEEKFNAVFHANSAITVLSKADTGTCVEINRTFCEKMGYRSDEIIGKTWADVLRLEGQYRQIVSEKLAKDGYLRDEEAIVYTRDEKPIPVMLSAQLFMLNGEHCHFIYAVDITKPKQTEEALKESELRQRALLRAIPDLVFRTRSDGMFLDCHAGNPHDLIAPPDAFIGHNIAEVLPREFVERHLYHSGLVLQTGEEQLYQYSVPIQGELADFEARMVFCAQDEAITIVRNVTKIKQAQRREFEFALERERRHLLTSFIKNAAHEFRTPLATIGTSAYLISRSNDPVQRNQRKNQIDSEIQRITRLIDMMTLITKLENTDSLLKDRVNVNEQIKAVGIEVKSKYNTGHMIYCDLQSDLPMVWGSAEYLSLVFHQLLDNAYHFTPENGTIRISSATVNNHIQIEVSDTGLGIAEEDLPHIFETFWRQDEAHSTPGFGLGLPIAQKIVQMHNGKIDVVSEMGKGTTFTIVLPRPDH
ncbi:MAG: PAS domain-containing sensor histidine kinase [Anaerolineae bacterium]